MAQMELLDEFVAAKRAIAQRYHDALAEVPGIGIMREAPWASSVFWMYTVLVDDKEYGIGSRDLLSVLSSHGIQTRPLWEPLHRSGAHQGSQAWRMKIEDRLYAQALSLPCSVGLSPEQQAEVIQRVTAVCEASIR